MYKLLNENNNIYCVYRYFFLSRSNEEHIINIYKKSMKYFFYKSQDRFFASTVTNKNKKGKTPK